MITLSIPVFAVGLAAVLGALIVYASLKSKSLVEPLKARNRELKDQNLALKQLLTYDPLTRCRSHRYFVAVVGRWLKSAKPGSVTLIIADIDHFKSINDSYGHGIGDIYLRAVGRALISHIGPRGVVARLGGDEFWIALQSIDETQSEREAEDLRRCIANVWIEIANQNVTRTASIGASRVQTGTDLSDAMREADTALYIAKAQGRNAVRSVDPALRKTLQHLKGMPNLDGIKRGLSAKEFTYFLQPIVDIGANKPIGFEALIRWVRDDGTIIMPADFLPVMNNDLLLSATPPADMATEIATTLETIPGDQFCSFNISNALLQSDPGNDVSPLRNITDGLDPTKTVLEIVESTLIDDVSRVSDILNELRASGFRIALDDFGSGQSDLMRLRELPIDIVKIDRSFIETLPNAPKSIAILKALVSMSNDLDFMIIAEGVEREAQLSCLQQLGIHYAQGYLLGAPAPLSEWEQITPQNQVAAAE